MKEVFGAVLTKDLAQVHARRLPTSSTGTAAVYTEHLKPTHIVRRVILRQISILNYVNPF
jgi:hypothetical protein